MLLFDIWRERSQCERSSSKCPALLGHPQGMPAQSCCHRIQGGSVSVSPSVTQTHILHPDVGLPSHELRPPTVYLRALGQQNKTRPSTPGLAVMLKGPVSRERIHVLGTWKEIRSSAMFYKLVSSPTLPSIHPQVAASSRVGRRLLQVVVTFSSCISRERC